MKGTNTTDVNTAGVEEAGTHLGLPSRLVTSVVWLCVLASAAVAWWSARRGFDFLDTGVYFLEYKFPDDVADTHTTYRLFARPFYLLAGENVVAFRYVSWLVLWAAATGLAWGWMRYLKTVFGSCADLLHSWPAALGLCLLASNAAYTIKPAALTYNSFNVVAVCVALGLMFNGVASLLRDPTDRHWRGSSQIAAAAAIGFIDILIKPTTAAFLVAAICLFVGGCPAIKREVKRKLLLIALGAALVGLGGMIWMVGGLDAFATRLRTLTSILENQAFMGELNTRTVREFTELRDFLWKDLRLVAIALAITALLLAAVRRNPVRSRWVATRGGVVVLALWLLSTVVGKLWRGSHGLYFEGIVARLYLGAVAVTAGCVLVTLLFGPRPKTSAQSGALYLKFVMWLMLVVTPFAGAYGSTTTVYLNGALYSVCWLLAVILSCAELSRRWQTRWVLPAAVIPLSVYAVAQLFHGQVVMPYMSPRPLWENTVLTAVGHDGSKVLLDKPTADCINETRAILTRHGFKPGDDIFCFFNVPGLVYAVGGRSPVIPWYFGRIYVGNPVEEIHMQAAGEERRRTAWIVTQAEVTQFRDHFIRGGIQFPDAYEEIGALKNPQSGLELKIWKPRSRL